MAATSSRRTFSNDERAYLYARSLIVVLTTGVYLLVFARMESSAERLMYLAALGVLALNTLGFFAAIFWWGARVERSMLVVLGPDLLVITAFVYLGMDGDAFYPVCVLVPVMYALVVRKREAWLVGAATAVAYMAAHAFYPHFTTTGYILFAAKAIAIPVVGALVAGSVAKQHSREDEVELAMLENQEINERLKRRVSELQAVSEITEVIHSSLDFDNVGPIVLDIVAKLIDIESCCLFIIDKQQSETIFSASVGSVDYAPGRAGIAAEPGDDAFHDGHFTCTSVFDRAEIMVLFCASAEDMERLSQEDSLVVGAVASELVVAVENSRLYKLTKRLAITDELTGLYNYRHLQQRLDEETSRARRYRKHLSLLMVDVDDFKHFNDNFGHIAGDSALSELAEVLRRSVREVDVAVRYGGEEFSVLLPETDSAGAYSVAEKIREAIAGHRFMDANGDRSCTLTVSVGTATYPAHATDKESLLREADDALYLAKNGGKNRVRSSQAHPSQTDIADMTGESS